MRRRPSQGLSTMFWRKRVHRYAKVFPAIIEHCLVLLPLVVVMIVVVSCCVPCSLLLFFVVLAVVLVLVAVLAVAV